MTGLVLKLSPKERLLINRAVVQNGDRRARLTILTADASILRLKDAIHPDDATTPVRRACFSVQLLLSGDCDHLRTRHQVLRQIEELSQVLQDHDSRHQLARATEFLLSGEHYQCLKALRALLSREDRLLQYSSP